MRGSDQIIFRAGGRDFTCADAVRAAEYRSALDPVREDTAAGMACQRYADEEGFELGPDEVESAANAYRTQHDLTTADDTEAWLEAHRLSLDDLSDWLARRLWRRRFVNQLHVITRDYRPDPDEVDSGLWPAVVFGDLLPGFERDFAARIAVRLAANHAANQPEWADDLAAMERLFLERCREALAASRLERELAVRGLSLMKVDVHLASFTSDAAAREAWLCVTQDGESLDEVCRRAGGEMQRLDLFLDELPQALQAPVLSAAPAHLIPPLRIDDRAVLCRVLAKQAPSMGDDRVRGRIETVLTERAIDDLIQRHIQWA